MRLSVSDLWTETLAIANRQREILFALGGFFFVLPQLLMTVLAPFTTQSKTLDEFAGNFESYVIANFPALLAANIVTSLGQFAVLVLLLDDRRLSVGEALAASLKRLPLFVAMVVLVNLMLMGGALLFVIPALYLYGRTMLAGPVLAAERAGPIAAIARSFELTKGNGWRLFAIAALIYLAGQIVAAASGAVVGSAAAIVGGRELSTIVGALVESVFSAITSMLVLIVGVAAYRQVAPQPRSSQ